VDWEPPHRCRALHPQRASKKAIAARLYDFRAIQTFRFEENVVIKSKKRKQTRKPYAAADIKLLRQHSKARTPVGKIAKLMKRSEGSLRQKALKLGIGLGHQRWINQRELCLREPLRLAVLKRQRAISNPGKRNDAVAISPVPEPATWAMLLIGFAGLGFLAYRRNKAPELRHAWSQLYLRYIMTAFGRSFILFCYFVSAFTRPETILGFAREEDRAFRREGNAFQMRDPLTQSSKSPNDIF
jgi:hypothetical protein